MIIKSKIDHILNDIGSRMKKQYYRRFMNKKCNIKKAFTAVPAVNAL